MSKRSIACSACGADVPQGRLSCPACGELLASVTGAMRSTSVTSEAERPMLDALLDDPLPSADATATTSDAATAAAAPTATAVAEPPAVLGLAAAPAFWPDDDLEDVVRVRIRARRRRTGARARIRGRSPSPRRPRSRPGRHPPTATSASVAPPPGSYLPPTAAPLPPPVLGTAALATASAGPAAPGACLGRGDSRPDGCR